MNYQNDKEYRECIRQFCQMNCIDDMSDIDDITRDENLYDSIAIQNKMDIIYEKTKECPFFNSLYDLAAGLMFSTDRQIGICVLLSYDYFCHFYTIYMLYETVGDDIEKEDCYLVLKNKLS